MKKTAVLYHANCQDGFTAAWAAWKKFGARAEYFAVKHQAPPPNGLRNKTLYLLDFSYAPRVDIVRRLARDNKSVTVIDHHQTAKDSFRPLFTTLKVVNKNAASNFEFVFNDKHSGAYLAWKYFHPGKPAPELVLYVEDADLWKFKKGSAKFVPYIDAHPFNFKVWNTLAEDFQSDKRRRALTEKARIVKQYADNIVRNIVSSAAQIKFEGHTVLAANCPVLRSEIGHELVKKRGAFSIVWREKGGQIAVSLRGNGKIDCAKIAEKYGGGGHKNAAGFVLTKEQKVPWRV